MDKQIYKNCEREGARLWERTRLQNNTELRSQRKNYRDNKRLAGHLEVSV